MGWPPIIVFCSTVWYLGSHEHVLSYHKQWKFDGQYVDKISIYWQQRIIYDGLEVRSPRFKLNMQHCTTCFNQEVILRHRYTFFCHLELLQWNTCHCILVIPSHFQLVFSSHLNWCWIHCSWDFFLLSSYLRRRFAEELTHVGRWFNWWPSRRAVT